MDAARTPQRRIAVVAHRRKQFGGGLTELRELIAADGVTDPLWFEVDKSRKAPKKVRKALRAGADLVLAWGGDGMVQRCVDALAGSDATLAILPAGTGNLLAHNLGVPIDLPAAVRTALHGAGRRLDAGKVNGERFAVMAGAGFDGALMGEADRKLKKKAGRLAYVLAGIRHVGDERVRTTITVDGDTLFDDEASCVLFGNIGTITGGVRAFDDARVDDGCLEVGVATAKGAVQWARTLGRMAVGRSEKSPFVQVTRGRKVTVRFAAKVPYELDGGARGATRRLKVRALPGAVTVRVPA